MTNYERIKNMSVEEMAGNLLSGQTYCPYLSFLEMEHCEVKNCYECIKQYLESEVETE